MIASTLFVTLCSLASPTSCHEERLTMQGASVQSCMAVAPFTIPVWLGDFMAGYSIGKWGCEPVETVKGQR